MYLFWGWDMRSTLYTQQMVSTSPVVSAKSLRSCAADTRADRENEAQRGDGASVRFAAHRSGGRWRLRGRAFFSAFSAGVSLRAMLRSMCASARSAICLRTCAVARARGRETSSARDAP